MYKDKVTIHLRCPRHPRYNGLIEGAIVGGCEACQSIFQVRRQVDWLKRINEEFGVNVAQPSGPPKSSRKS